ncbi:MULTISPECIES: MATE family efflux transporter [Roseobacteraceae]|uniref:MATE family multidrug exporter n=1 Tax=Pseudosulfitobacter pseudonitzschiae TaxID=1402135 RepID=A0A221JXC5_9RHOB|nr:MULTISPECIES: MATE family efflux transporter [Roseobacteraceae]ASM71392.1 MATE family multidrug exporter [Pseudosulfitobacter pseudonitzschiae]
MPDTATAPLRPAMNLPDATAAARVARTHRLLNGPIGPTLARLAAPNVLAMFVTSVTSIAEAYFAGRMGVNALAGLALVFPLMMLTQMLAAGAMGGAISAAVARALGGGDTARASGLTLAAWIIGVVAAAGSAVLMALFGRAVFTALGGDAAAVAAALSYAGVFFPGCIALWLCHASLSVIRGTGNMAMPSLLLFVVSLGSIPVSGALALGWGPFPAWGMAGLAAGLIVSNGAAGLVAMAMLLAGRMGLSMDGALSRLRGEMFRDILRVGVIASVNSAQSVLTIVLMVALVGRFGTAALAGYGLGARLEFLMIPVVFGIGAAMTSMVGANIGAGNTARALRVAWTGAIAAAVIVGGIGALVAVFPDLWLRIFLDASDTATLEVGRAYFRTVAPFYAFFGLGLALFFASQGAARMMWPVMASLFRMAVAFGVALLLIQVTDLGVRGVFIGVASGMLVYGVVTAAAVWITRWR